MGSDFSMKTNHWRTFLMTLLVAISMVPLNAIVHADTYGGGEEEKSIKIVKEVRLEGDNNYKDKVFIDLTDANERTKEIYFRITITNTGDKIDKLKMEDFLPSELKLIAGNLTEEWNELDAGETKTFIIKASLKDSEVKEDKDYEKCVVNKAELRQDGDFMGSDVATVCYGNTPTELPETGFWPMSGFAGLGMVSLGRLLKSKTKQTKVTTKKVVAKKK
jgi:hypothetical protein